MDLYKFFIEEVYPLNKEGDVNRDWEAFENLMSMHITDNDNMEMTPQRFKKKYKEYVAYWDKVYLPKMKAGYLKSGDEKYPISFYINTKSYFKSFQMPKENRDYYLFGDMTVEELEKQHHQFIRKFDRHGSS